MNFLNTSLPLTQRRYNKNNYISTRIQCLFHKKLSRALY